MKALGRFRAGVAVAVLVSVLGGCSAPQLGSGEDPGTGPRVAPTADLQPFYSQQLAWEKCGPGQQCATLTVPLDYADPEGETLELSVLRNLATGPDPLGPLVVNPGGPGGSGVDYAARAASAVSPTLRSSYTVVGFDPRGVKRSRPIECLSDSKRDALLAQDSSPDDPAEVELVSADADAIAEGCLSDDSELLSHISSEEVAADMDVLRAALDEEKLNYLGFSYGTLLGALYAEAFPQNVGRIVLDGGMDPSLTNSEISLGQAKGFELALRRYLSDCVAGGDCPLGSSVDEAYSRLQTFLAELDAQPLPTGDPDRPLTQGIALNAVAYPLYTPDYGWPLLTANLRLALLGDGSGLLEIVDLFARRNADGTYDDNGLEMLYAVNCLDRPAGPTDQDTTETSVAQWSEAAPIFGAPLGYSNVACERWPIEPTGKAASVSAAGTPPIVVVGTEFDPATPYEWSVALAQQLSDGRLVSRIGGDGHTSYRGGSTCIDQIVDSYLITGDAPPDGTECSD